MRRSFRSSVRVVAACAAGCLAAAGCGTSGTTNSAARYAVDGTFTYAYYRDPGRFDPYRNVGVAGFSGLAYDSLVNLRPDGSFVSGLADKWTVDARSATFVLRPGVTCSDGTPLRASQVAADINYVGDPKNASVLYGVNVPTVPLAVTSDDTARSVHVVLAKPFGFLLSTVGLLPVMCARGLANAASLDHSSDGTGPFVLTKTTTGQDYTFTRRDDYTWGPNGAGTKAPGTPKTILLKIIPNETTAANLLLSGQVNFARVLGQDRARLDAAGLAKASVRRADTWLWFNEMSNRDTADERVRQALVQALDLNQIVRVSTGGTGYAAGGLVSIEPNPCPGDTVTGHLPKHDDAAAKALLDAAGWTTGSDGVRHKGGATLALDLDYVAAQSALARPTAELIAARWTAIGVQVHLTGLDTYTNVLFGTSNYDVFIAGFGASLPTTLMPYLSGPTPPHGTNIAGIHNPAYESLAARAETLTPPAACQSWQQAEQALWRAVNPVPISDDAQPFYLRKATAQIAGQMWPIPTSIRVFQ